MRSNLDEGEGIIQKKDSDDSTANRNSSKQEINYCYVLNKILPDEIRVLASTPVEPEFKARYDYNGFLN